ncbi:MAG TPA: cytochrome c3 family protein, partial [bacterium]|nr:cytochrome c3 family protein [bacterium]
CHGPQVSQLHGSLNIPFAQGRVSYKAEACATCHASGSGHHIYSEWNTQAPVNDAGVKMGHSNRGMIALGSSATGLSSSCGRCHTAQGYTLYSDLLKQGKVALNSVPSATLASITTANAEPVTCVACHDPHDATNPQQLRFYGDTPLLPGGFAGYGMGKGAVCLSCHNSRNGAQGTSDTLTYLHEDGETYNSGNPTAYSAPHQAAQGDLFMGRNAYFMGTSLPLLSKHAAIEDTCVGCHMTLQPKTHLSHGTPAKSEHLFRIEDEDLQTLCSNCHGANVNGEAIQSQIETLLTNLTTKMGNAVKAKANAVAGGSIRVRAYDATTDFYSTASTSTSNVLIDVTANPITSVGIEEIHGQIGFVLTFTNPVLGVPFVDAAGNAAPSKDMQTIAVQMGSLKDNQATPAALYALTGNMVRAGWNYFLVEGDQSKGLHNPTFATAVLNNSIAKDLSN